MRSEGEFREGKPWNTRAYDSNRKLLFRVQQGTIIRKNDDWNSWNHSKPTLPQLNRISSPILVIFQNRPLKFWSRAWICLVPDAVFPGVMTALGGFQWKIFGRKGQVVLAEADPRMIWLKSENEDLLLINLFASVMNWKDQFTIIKTNRHGPQSMAFTGSQQQQHPNQNDFTQIEE